jgi:shikimate dehydrogenase
MTIPITAKTRLAGVVGAPVVHSLSPRLHNAWLGAAGLDAVYLAFPAPEQGFEALVHGLRGGVVAGLNVTIPFKERALALADQASDVARMAGAANLLVFSSDGSIRADNTDAEGLIGAIRAQAPGLDPGAGPALILGAGGAARGAAAALIEAGAPQVRVLNRGLVRARALTQALGPKTLAFEESRIEAAVDGAQLIVNATSLGLGGGPGPSLPWPALDPQAVVVDMVYKPLLTDFLRKAAARDHRTVDGLEILIRQAIPSFQAFFGQAPPDFVDVRALLLGEMER